MMKKYIMALLVAFGAATTLKAQEVVTLEGLQPRGFSGVKSINGEFFYTSSFGEKTETKGMANYIVAIYDRDLKLVKKIPVLRYPNIQTLQPLRSTENISFSFLLMKEKRTAL